MQNTKHGRNGKQQMKTKHINARKKIEQVKQNTQRHGTDTTQEKHGTTRSERTLNETQHGLERNILT